MLGSPVLDGTLEPDGGSVHPDPESPELGIEFKRADTERYAVSDDGAPADESQVLTRARDRGPTLGTNAAAGSTPPGTSASGVGRWTMKRLGAAPCQWSSSGAKKTRSPGRMTLMGPPRRWTRPMPSVT
jgi:hypothetical protein